MESYYPLFRWLQQQPGRELRLTFGQIEEILKRPLPSSAKLHAAWWANEDPEKTRHVQCRAWRLAGWRASAQIIGGLVTFSREGAAPLAPSALLGRDEFDKP